MSTIYKFSFGLVLCAAGIFAVIEHYDSEKTTEKNNMTASEIMTSLRTKVVGTTDYIAGKYFSQDDLGDGNFKNIQCFSDELQYLDIEKEILLPIRQNIKSRNVLSLKEILADDFKAHEFNHNVSSERNLEGITHLKFEKGNKLVNKSEFLNDLEYFINDYKNIEFVEIVGESYFSPPASRLNNRKMANALIKVRYDIRGHFSNGGKVQDRGIMSIYVKLDKENKWKAQRIEFVERDRLATQKTFFEETTSQRKIAELVPSYLRREAIRRGGYAMAIGDYNNDDNVDIFVATVAESVLLKGNDKGELHLDKQAALENRSLVKAAAFADFDNDGSDELLLARFAPNETQSNENRSDIIVLNNNQGHFTSSRGIANYDKKTSYAMPMALADFDGDNKLDFYIGFPGSKDFTTLEPAVQEKGIVTQGIFFNQGNGTFKDDPYKQFASEYNLNKEGHYDDLSKIFPHAALAADYNDDGTQDLIVIDDRGNLSPIYENDGRGNLKFSSSKIGVGLKDYGMGAEAGDLNEDGRTDFLMSSVNFNASKRLKKSCEVNWSVDDLITAGTSGLRSFESNKNGTFTETTEKNGLSWVGEGAGGVTLIDYNNDGLLDIYLVNGLWTGTEEDQSQDLASYFVIASSLGMLENDIKSELQNENIVYKTVRGNDFKSLLFRSNSQSAIMDILSFYKGDIHASANLKNSNMAPSLGGAQRNRMFRNNGDGTYTEVGYMLGVDSVADGYMSATADFDKDGKMDLVLRNADPGFDENQFQPVQIFKNNGAYESESLVIALRGTNSNSNAVGAKLVATIGQRKVHRQMIGNKGTVQSERIFHIGLNKEEKVDRLDIIWPSGQKQTMFDMTKGFYKIIEPETVKSKNVAIK